MTLRKTISMLLSTMMLSGMFMFALVEPAKADVIQENECFPAVLLLRGSGENRITQGDADHYTYFKEMNGEKNSFIETNGYEGPILQKLLQSFTNQTNPTQTVSKTRFIGVDYEALDVIPDLGTGTVSLEQSVTIKSARMAHHVIKYQDSYNEGADKILGIIKANEARGCNTQYMIAGYSQGVISARLAINLLDNNEDKIISTYAIGDPVNKGNAELSERQVSPAHTASDRGGVLRTGLSFLRQAQLSSPATVIQSFKTKAYLDTLTNSDSLIYNDDVSTGVYSRVLCHDQDLICDAWAGSSMKNHMNYFSAKVLPTDENGQGDVDLEHEIEAFDQQVQTLANSAPSNPRARVLKKTPSVNTSATLYNVANARVDDKCSWDEGNDGTYEVTDIDCGVYAYANTATTEKMRVKVTDSFGSTYFFELMDEVLEIEQIDHVLELDPNSWYQFKVKDMPLTEKDKNEGYYFDDDENKMVFDEDWEPSFTGEQCIDWSRQAPDELIDDYNWNSDMVDCKTNFRNGNAYDSMQVFKPTKEGMKSGYDEDYSWGIDNLDSDYFTIRPVKNNKNSFTPILSEVMNDKAYYSFTNGKKCVSTKDVDTGGRSSLLIESCTGEGHQLFEATQVAGEFGELSMEKDITPPVSPSNVFLEIDDYSSLALLSWDKVEDRGIETIYEVYEYTIQDNHYELIEEIYGTDRTVLIYTDEMEEGDTAVYVIRAMDETGKYSPYSPLIFKKQEGVKNPARPAILDIAPDGTNITLKLPEYDTIKIQGVRVYDKNNYLGTHTGSSVTLSTASNTKHEFTYRFEIEPQIFSPKSNKLTTTIS